MGIEENTVDDKKRCKNRDKCFRCRICLQLWNDEECEVDPEKGYICPNGCEATYIQPEYESPLNSTTPNEDTRN
jgi:hypothetical protein